MMGYKIYLSGSTQEDNVGVGNYGTEEQQMQSLVNKIIFYLQKGGEDLEIFRNNGNMTLQESIDDSNSKNPDVHLALHTNAGGGKGTEAYYSNYPVYSSDSHRFTKFIYDAVAPITVSSDRGVKPDTSAYSVGLAECRETTAVATLIEIMFHDNLTDVNDYLIKVEQIAKSIAIAIYNYFGLEYKIIQDNLVYRVITGSFKEKENAEKRVKQLKESGFDSFVEVKKL